MEGARDAWAPWPEGALLIGLCLSIACLLLRRAHRVLMEQAVAGARQRERDAVARDLHDTVLQSAQAIILMLQSMVDVMDVGDPRRGQLLQLIGDAEALLAEGRDRIQDLRAPIRATQDLPAAFDASASGLQLPQRPAVHTVVTGQVRPLCPRAGDAAFQIAREAIRNAARHGRAAAIAVDIEFAPDALRLRVRDNGTGFDLQRPAARAGHGHWGLLGMAERAEVVGGRLRIRSRPGHGTELELAIPGRAAYPPGACRGRP